MIRIALYSPDARLRCLLASALCTDYELAVEERIAQLKQTVRAAGADVLVLDCDAPDSSLEQQLDLYRNLADLHIPTIVMTGDTRRSTAMQFIQCGADDCIRKPPSLVEFKVVVERAYEHHQMRRELESMRLTMNQTFGYDRLVGSSGRSQVVYDLIRRVANLNAFVLIKGESGTGKELVARAIHNRGARARHPFVAVSCGAIPESLIEAELFGHEKGAFTGSTASHAGYLEQAGEGTIFLDEIGELSLNTQVKLLRVLQEKAFTRLGGTKLIPLQARVLFATHRNLHEMLEAGTFRSDLFYRVNVMTIHVPPLRERTEDIPQLARHFLKQYAAEFGKAIVDIRPTALEALVEYEWPGNVRELENVIQSAVILADGDSLTTADLPEFLRHSVSEEGAPANTLEAEGFECLLRHYKYNLASQAIEECHGNKTLAARKLGVSRAYLHRLIRLQPGEADELHSTNVTPFPGMASAS